MYLQKFKIYFFICRHTSLWILFQRCFRLLCRSNWIYLWDRQASFLNYFLWIYVNNVWKVHTLNSRSVLGRSFGDFLPENWFGPLVFTTNCHKYVDIWWQSLKDWYLFHRIKKSWKIDEVYCKILQILFLPWWMILRYKSPVICFYCFILTI